MEDHEAKTAAMLEAVQSEPGEVCVLDCYFCRRCGKTVADESQFSEHLHGDEDRSPQPPRALIPFAITVLSRSQGAETGARAAPKAGGKGKPARTPRYTPGPWASDRDLAITAGLASYEGEDPASATPPRQRKK